MTQTTGLKRNTIDKYYTKKSVVEICLQQFKKHIIIKDNDIIIEPSAGNGSFINNIKSISNNYIFYDIQPENNEIIKQDFIQLDSENFKQYDNIHIIGNPPFGRQSTLAIKFIKKSCEFSNSVSFILPMSFKKESSKKHFPLNFHLLIEYDLPSNSFIVDETEYDVPCVFQIWQKKNIYREKPEILSPNNFTFVKKNDNPDLSFRRVGVNAGNVSQNIHDKSEQSHYFIKLTKKNIDSNLISILNSIKFDSSEYTVGPKSISKQELIKEFNNVLNV
tara:strand:+ start:487 stop:1314 length:828 start_codon:yes stop_codon:yes gene_type:complete